MNKANIIECTEELINTVNEDDAFTADSLVAVSFVYRKDKMTKAPIIGLNVQVYGHNLYIVPDVSEMKTYYRYVTNTTGMSSEKCRSSIIRDLIGDKGFSKVDAAKLMKCSVGTVNRLLDMDMD